MTAIVSLIERLRDLHKQATVERSHYYVGKCALEAADRIEALEAALRRIDAINDSPATFNKDIDDVCRVALAPEQDK